jgi:probable HAF family extracellular repeat protein
MVATALSPFGIEFMARRQRMKSSFLFVLATCCALASVAAVNYKFSPAGNYPGAAQTFPLAANLRQIVGYYASVSAGGAYIQNIGESARTPFLAISPPNSNGTAYASGVNSQGVTAGGYCIPPQGCTYPQSQHGFTWDNGAFTTIDYPGATSGGAYGINDLGQIVGGFCTTGNVCGGTVLNPTAHAFLDDHGTFTQLDYPGAFETQANAINNAGQIAGVYNSVPGGLKSFLYQNGVYTSLQDPNAVWTNATAINNHGVVAGYYQDGQLHTHGFLYQNGKFVTLDHPDAGSTSLDGINDDGVTVGAWFHTNGLLDNFKAIPVR